MKSDKPVMYKNLVVAPVLNREGTQFKLDRKGNVKTKLVLHDSQYEMEGSDLAWYNALSIAQKAAYVGAVLGVIAGVLVSLIH